MRFLRLILVALPVVAMAGPSNGIVALSDSSVIVSDTIHNAVWRFEKGQPAQKLTGDEKFPCHWLTKGLDGELYAETLSKEGKSWSEGIFRLDTTGANPKAVAPEPPGSFGVFAVDRKGEIVYQAKGSLQSLVAGAPTLFRKNGRPARHEPGLGEVSVFAWGAADIHVLADGANIRQVGSDGVVHKVATITGRITNYPFAGPRNTPIVSGLAIDGQGRIIVAVPSIGQVLRLETDRTLTTLMSYDDDWTATGVAEAGGTVFLLESKTSPNAVEGPRVRAIGPDGVAVLIGMAV